MKQNWIYKKIGEVCDDAQTYKWEKEEKYYIDLSSVDRVSHCITETLTINKENAPSRAKQFVKKGDVLFGTTRPTMKRVCIIDNQYDNQICSTGFCVLRPTNIVTSQWIFFNLLSNTFFSYIEPLQNGVAYPAVSNKDVRNFPIPVPPLADQSRIVAELDLLQSIIDKQKAQLKEYDTLAQSIFYDMFGDPVDNEKGWDVKKLGEICWKITDGVHAKPKYTETGMPFISVVNINKGKLLFDNCKYVSQQDGESFNKRTKPEKGDILYTKVGATYGIPAIVDTDMEFCLYVSVCLIKPKKEIIDSVFLKSMMALPFIKTQADKKIRGIGVPDLHLNQIGIFDIILPPLPLQQKFAEKIETIEQQKTRISQSIAEAQKLFDYTMDKYFG